MKQRAIVKYKCVTVIPLNDINK